MARLETLYQKPSKLFGYQGRPLRQWNPTYSGEYPVTPPWEIYINGSRTDDYWAAFDNSSDDSVHLQGGDRLDIYTPTGDLPFVAFSINASMGGGLSGTAWAWNIYYLGTGLPYDPVYVNPGGGPSWTYADARHGDNGPGEILLLPCYSGDIGGLTKVTSGIRFRPTYGCNLKYITYYYSSELH